MLEIGIIIYLISGGFLIHDYLTYCNNTGQTRKHQFEKFWQGFLFLGLVICPILNTIAAIALLITESPEIN